MELELEPPDLAPELELDDDDDAADDDDADDDGVLPRVGVRRTGG